MPNPPGRPRLDAAVSNESLAPASREPGKNAPEMRRVLDQAESIGSVDELAEHGIKPLMVMADSRYTEIQRDAAAALYSLAISDKNKAAFLEARALETLVKLANVNDLDIRRNVAGAVDSSGQCPGRLSRKRPV